MPLAIDASSKMGFFQPLHCFILWLQATNCYMQIEDCVSDYGVQHRIPFEAEMMALCVDVGALRAMYLIHDSM